MDTKDKNNSTDIWICPHCGSQKGATIIEDSVLKDDFREILCGCLDCDELFIRVYQFVEVIKLNREIKK